MGILIWKLGRDLTLDEGYIAAQHVGLRILSQLKAACNGDLDRVVKCLQIRGFVNCTDDFTQQSGVINGVNLMHHSNRYMLKLQIHMLEEKQLISPNLLMQLKNLVVASPQQFLS